MEESQQKPKRTAKLVYIAGTVIIIILATVLVKMNKKIDSLSRENIDLQANIISVEYQAKQAKAMAEDASNDSTTKQEYEDNSSEIEDLSSKIKEVESDKDDLSSSVDSLTMEVHSLKSESDDLRYNFDRFKRCLGNNEAEFCANSNW